MESNRIELQAADALLDIGVKLPVRAPMFLRMFGIKNINLMIKQPYSGTGIRAGRLYLKAQKNGIDAETVTEALEVRERNAMLIARAVAVFVLRGKLLSWLFAKLLAYWLIDGVPQKTQLNIMNTLVLTGIEDFMITIRLTAHLKMTARKLSPMERES